MGNSTIQYDPIVQSQAGKEITANSFFDAATAALLYGRRASNCSGLTWGYWGGNVLVNGVLVQIAAGALSLAPSVTNYIEAIPSTGAISSNSTAFTAGRVPLYSVICGASSVTGYTDYRIAVPDIVGRLVRALSDANATLSQEESRNQILEFTGALNAGRNIVIPLEPKQYTVFNNTSGGFALTFIGASGSGVAIAAGKRAIIYTDGTNVVRVTSDI